MKDILLFQKHKERIKKNKIRILLKSVWKIKNRMETLFQKWVIKIEKVVFSFKIWEILKYPIWLMLVSSIYVDFSPSPNKLVSSSYKTVGWFYS